MGGSSPAPKTFTPPPLQNEPVSPPIPNFFANRPIGQSPYEMMAQFAPRPVMGPMGQQIAPMQFTPPTMVQPTPQQEAVAQIVQAVAAPDNGMTESQRRHRLGKGQR